MVAVMPLAVVAVVAEVATSRELERTSAVPVAKAELRAVAEAEVVVDEEDVVDVGEGTSPRTKGRPTRLPASGKSTGRRPTNPTTRTMPVAPRWWIALPSPRIWETL